MNRNNCIVELNGLSVAFKQGPINTQAVRDARFQLVPGRTTALVGESGSGKSVTSLVLLNLLHTDQIGAFGGTIQMRPPLTEEPRTFSPGDVELNQFRGKDIAMIFQEPMTALNPVMKCGPQVMECLETHTELSRTQAREEVIRLFEEVSIPHPEEAFEKYPHQMSGGQRQRVMIAMAISCKPKVLIADEPTTALDVTVQRAVLELLKQLQTKYNMAMLFITHDLGIVEDIADDILVMESGRIVESGNVQEVLHQPKEDYTKRLIAARPSPDKKGIPLGADALIHVKQAVHEDTGATLLEARGISKEYESGNAFSKKKIFRALNNISFTIHEGETLGLVGESGCGKSTLSRILPGLIPASAGEIWFRGMNLISSTKRQKQEAMKDIQIVFQDPYSALNPTMSAGEIVGEPISFYGLRESASARKARVIELLEKVGLGESHFQRYPHEFSGGQRQRIVIARALAVEPKLLICDESVSALDVSVQAQVLNLLNQLKADFGLTFLFISHDLNVVYYMSDRIMVMRAGMIEEIGPAADVFYSPRSPYTRSLLASIPGGTRRW